MKRLFAWLALLFGDPACATCGHVGHEQEACPFMCRKPICLGNRGRHPHQYGRYCKKCKPLLCGGCMEYCYFCPEVVCHLEAGHGPSSCRE